MSVNRWNKHGHYEKNINPVSPTSYKNPRRITTQQYDKLRKQWVDKKEGYQKRIDRINNADKEYYITASYLLELASRSYELFLGSEPEQKRQIITLTLQNLTIKDGKIYYEWQKPFNSIFNSCERLTWGRVRDLVRTLYIQ